MRTNLRRMCTNLRSCTPCRQMRQMCTNLKHVDLARHADKCVRISDELIADTHESPSMTAICFQPTTCMGIAPSQAAFLRIGSPLVLRLQLLIALPLELLRLRFLLRFLSFRLELLRLCSSLWFWSFLSLLSFRPLCFGFGRCSSRFGSAFSMRFWIFLTRLLMPFKISSSSSRVPSCPYVFRRYFRMSFSFSASSSSALTSRPLLSFGFSSGMCSQKLG